VLVCLNITVASGTGGLQTHIQCIDPAGGAALTYLNTPPAITATGVYGYLLYPGATQAGVTGSQRVQVLLAGVLSRTWQATVTVGDASSYTYSLGYTLIV
jgi:hypothetical protein